MTYSIIQKSKPEGAKRLDAEYYQPEYLDNSEKIKNFGFDKLQSLSLIDITKGETPLWRGDGYLDQGIPFLRSENLIPAGLNLSNLVFVSEKVHERMKRSKIYPDDILIAIVGATIGHAGLVTDEYLEYNSNQANAIIRPKDRQTTHFLSVILETRFCQLQIDRLKGGGARDNLDLHEVRVIKIPKPTKEILKYCDEIVTEIKKSRKESESQYQQAEDLLLEELGLKDFEVKDELSSTVDFSDIKNSNRMDAEYFRQKYEDIVEKIKNYKGGSDCVKNQFVQNKTLSKRNKDFYNYVEISDVKVSSGEINFNKVAKEDLPANAKIKLEKNDLLVSKVRPYRGAVGIVDLRNDDLLGSGAFTALREKTGIKKEVLVVLLRTIFYKELMMRCNVGTSYPVIKDEDILNLQIPILPKQTQEKIADLVQKSHEARKRAKELLEQAKQKVEDLIEQK